MLLSAQISSIIIIIDKSCLRLKNKTKSMQANQDEHEPTNITHGLTITMTSQQLHVAIAR